MVCPIRQGTDVLRESLALTNCRYIPWDNGLPTTRKSVLVDGARIKVLIPLLDWTTSSVDPEILNVVWRTLHKCPYVDITFVYCPRGFRVGDYKAIKRIEKLFGASGQFRSISDRKLSRDDILTLYGRHDLTVWPSEQEGFGSVGLDSLSMGTPVMAYDVAPQSEFLRDGKNSVLVPCELKYNWLGVPWVLPNSPKFEEHLVALVDRPDLLGELRRFTRFGMAARRDKFVTGWSQVIGNS